MTCLDDNDVEQGPFDEEFVGDRRVLDDGGEAG